MIASAGAYLAIRDLFHWVHPWWARVAVVAGLAAIIFAIAFVQQVTEDRRTERQRAVYRARLAELERRSSVPRSLLDRYEHAPRARRGLYRGDDDGTCASWIPEGFEPKKVYR